MVARSTPIADDKLAKPAAPEIRLRLDPTMHQEFERIGNAIGLTPQDMVKAFVRRTILAQGMPFAMHQGRMAANDNPNPISESTMRVHEAPIGHIASIARAAAAVADREHVRAGRLPVDDTKSLAQSR